MVEISLLLPRQVFFLPPPVIARSPSSLPAVELPLIGRRIHIEHLEQDFVLFQESDCPGRRFAHFHSPPPSYEFVGQSFSISRPLGIFGPDIVSDVIRATVRAHLGAVVALVARAGGTAEPLPQVAPRGLKSAIALRLALTREGEQRSDGDVGVDLANVIRDVDRVGKRKAAGGANDELWHLGLLSKPLQERSAHAHDVLKKRSEPPEPTDGPPAN